LQILKKDMIFWMRLKLPLCPRILRSKIKVLA
jgi:hypothetical protein